jgi:uncharacterized membrane protein YkvA (DUF1232 family)
MFQLIQTLIYVGGGLLLALMVCMSLPQSKLREVLMPIIGWCFALFCGAYVFSPVDIVPEALLGPFGLIDDAGAVILGIASARAAINAKSR